MRLANKGISSFNRGRIRAEGQGLVRSELHDAPPTSHLSSTLIIIHYSIFISHPQAAESSVCNGQVYQRKDVGFLRAIDLAAKERNGPEKWVCERRNVVPIVHGSRGGERV